MSTTVYVPQVIESAEQAEALPLGTPVWNLRPHDFVDDRGYVDTVSGQRVVDTVTGRHFAADMVGWTALVPVEVEVEYIRESGARRREKTLYVTPWKDPR